MAETGKFCQPFLLRGRNNCRKGKPGRLGHCGLQVLYDVIGDEAGLRCVTKADKGLTVFGLNSHASPPTPPCVATPLQGSLPHTDCKMDSFKKIYIEVTNCCNLSCSFCHQSKRPKAFMKAVEFAEVLEKIKGYTRFIYLHVLGEALLHPEFELLLEMSHRAGLQVNLSTNGTLLNRRREALLASPAIRQINVSLHSQNSPDFPPFSDYLNEILSFYRAARERSIWFNLRLWDIQGEREHPAGNSVGQIGRHLQAAFSLPEQLCRRPCPRGKPYPGAGPVSQPGTAIHLAACSNRGNGRTGDLPGSARPYRHPGGRHCGALLPGWRGRYRPRQHPPADSR